MKTDTILAQAGSRRDPLTGAISMPIYPSAAFQHPALGRSTGFDYSRTANPTRKALEETVAALEGGAGAFAFSSGLAALDAVFRLFSPGGTVAVTEDLYGGTYRLLEKFSRFLNLDFLYLDTSDTAAVIKAIDQPGIKGLFVESPSNPFLKVADLEALGKASRERGILFITDNTFLTPVLCRPMDFGADITVYSATKYLGGHNDLIAGLAVARSKDLSDRLGFIQNATGAVLGPFESWLLLRSLKTLSLRLKKHEENARIAASFLNGHKHVKKLYYPGLPDNPGHTVLARQSAGFGAMIAFEVDSRARVEHILSSVKVFMFAESLGAPESLVTFPLVQTHADMDVAVLDRLGLHDRLLRLSIGLEDPSDLLADLAAVLE
ncbi:MAG: PLP-dependent aspartate aminotransferase family protein [Desulfovibrio sp.]|jgi:cystathionine beta-lyase/cystathionine gamma-synthase|nr:PLP-dependent aspartate aminotransferase family protein [Desulfovibrio sp.]